MEKMGRVWMSYRNTIIGLTAGVIGGYMYYRFVGCDSGGCAITSNPINSMAYFGFLGALTGNSFKSKKATTKINHL